MKRFIRIREIKTNIVEKEFDVTEKSERSIDRIDNGIKINLNHNEYYTSIEEEE